MKIKSLIRKATISTITLVLSTALAFAFEEYGLRRENILLLYVASIMFIMYQTQNIHLGLGSILIFVFSFNFFFTEPKFTFIIDDPNYIITIIIFSLVAITMGALTTKLQREVFTSRDNEHKIQLLYEISRDLLQAHSQEEIINIEIANLSHILEREVSVYLFDIESTDENINKYKFEIEYAIVNGTMCGKSEKKFSNLPILIFPFGIGQGTKGAIIINCETTLLNKQEKEFIQANLMHFSSAIEKDKFSKERENTRIVMEKERLKSALLRSISHDLRTPLTTLQTGTSFLYDSYNEIDDETKKSMMLDINNETSRLNEFVENLLNMTKLNADQLKLTLKSELVEDLLIEAASKVKNRLQHHKLDVVKKNELDYIVADIPLILQVLVNLLDNAIRHTKDDATITIKYTMELKQITFSIEDDGGGISTDNIPYIFDDFVSIKNNKEDKARGIGLGLSICKAIIIAHGGTIKAYNNNLGGATFEFTIPIVEE